MFKSLIILFFLAGMVTAYQDVIINVNDKAMGMCLSADNMDFPVCSNETLVLDGTSDHIIYILPETDISPGDNLPTKFIYVLFTPLNVIIGGLGLFVFAVLFAAGCIVWLLRINGVKIF